MDVTSESLRIRRGTGSAPRPRIGSGSPKMIETLPSSGRLLTDLDGCHPLPACPDNRFHVEWSRLTPVGFLNALEDLVPQLLESALPDLILDAFHVSVAQRPWFRGQTFEQFVFNI